MLLSSISFCPISVDLFHICDILCWVMHMIVIFVCFMVFAAGFVDSIAGGGGLISLPAYLMSGYPIHKMLGTNKTSSTCGTLVSTIQYFKHGQIHLPSALVSAAFALIGSYLGASTSLLIDSRSLKMVVVCLLPLVSFVLSRSLQYKKKKAQTAAVTANQEFPITSKLLTACAVLGFGIGFYDGMLGPGTGTFLIIGYSALGFSLTTASGNAKVVNLCSNIAAFIRFMISGNIIWTLAIPAAICGIFGNFLGSRLAIKKGEQIIRPLVYSMVLIVFLTFISDLLFQ